MRRNAPPVVENLDPALRPTARRPGPIRDEWGESAPGQAAHAAQSPLEAIVARMARPAPRPGPVPDLAHAGGPNLDRLAAALDAVVDRLASAEDRARELSETTVEQQDRLATSLAAVLSAIGDRLEAVETNLEQSSETTAKVSEESHGISAALETMRDDLASLSEKFGSDRDKNWSNAVATMRSDVESLRTSIGGLATRGALEELEKGLHRIASDLIASRSGDIGALARKTDDLKREISALAEHSRAGLREHVTAELASLRARIEELAAPTGDEIGLSDLRASLLALQAQVSELADPARIDTLSQEVAVIGRHLAEIRLNQVGRKEFAGLAKGLEEIFSRLDGVKALNSANLPARLDQVQASVKALGTADLPGRLDQVQASVKELLERPADNSSLEAGLGRLEQRVGAMSAGLPARLDGLRNGIQELLARPDMKVPEGLLATLAKLEQNMAGLASGQVQHDAALDLGFAGLSSKTDRVLAAVAAIPGPLLERLDEHGAALEIGFVGVSSKADRILTEVEATSRPVLEKLDQHGVHLETGLAGLSSKVDRIAAEIEATSNPILEGLDQLASLPAKTDRILAALEVQPPSVALDGLVSQVEQIATELTSPSSPLLERLDRIGDDIARAGHQADTAALELMLRSIQERIGEKPDTEAIEQALRSLNEKFDPAETQAALDRMSQQIGAMTAHLARTATGEPMQGVATEITEAARRMYEDAVVIAERAARAAIQEAAVTRGGVPPEFETIRTELAALKALHAESEQRTQHTLKAVHNALETLVLRNQSGGGPVAPLGEPAAPDAPPAVRLETAVRRLHAAAMAQAETLRNPHASRVDDPGDVLLEPGERPAPNSAVAVSDDAGPNTLRAGLIAAARRSRRNNAERMQEAGPPEPNADAPREPPISNQTLIERIRQTFDHGRRPLVLGLVAAALAGGAVQITNGLRSDPSGEEAASDPAQAGVPATASAGPDLASGPAKPAGIPGERSVSAKEAPAATGSLTEPSTGLADLAEIDLPSALPEMMQDAVRRGEPGAVHELASRLADGRGLARDPALAARLFERAAQAGYAPAQFRLGNLFEKGTGVGRDVALARYWYEQAAEGGNTRAMHNLAVILAEGIDGRPDYAVALRWFRSAAEHGLRDSQFNLGVLLARGLGTSQDFAGSYLWFALAAAQGDEEAARKREEVAARLQPAELAMARSQAEAWRVKPAAPGANEGALQATGPARTPEIAGAGV
jgi:localization factor PodJL